MRRAVFALLAACGGATAAETPPSTERSVDVSKLGAECSISVHCPSGQDCLFWSGVDRSLTSARCFAGADPCAIVKCPTGWSCVVLDSYPGQVACER